MAAATKSTQIRTDWEAIAPAGSTLSLDIDVSTDLVSGVTATVVHTDANANALGVLVTIDGRMGPNDEDWSELYTLRLGVGTAATIDVDDTTSGFTVPVSATANFETLWDRYFLKDSTLINSEIIRNNGFSSDVQINTLDALENVHANTADVYTLVADKYFPIPPELSTVRVLFLNDDADSNVAVRVAVTRQTAIG